MQAVALAFACIPCIRIHWPLEQLHAELGCFPGPEHSQTTCTALPDTCSRAEVPYTQLCRHCLTCSSTCNRAGSCMPS